MGNKSSCCVTNSPSVSSSYRSGAGVHPSANNNNNNSIRSTHNNNSSSKKYQHNQPGVHLNYSGVGYHGNQRNNTGGGGGSGSGAGAFYHNEYDNNHHPYHPNNNHSSSTWIREETSCNLQHISEREPDDIDQDPSTHPTKGPIFMERSKSEIKIRDNRLSLYFINNALRHQCTMTSSFRGPSGPNGVTGGTSNALGSSTTTVPYGRLVKSSSCSTIFLDDSTISQPNLKNTIKCISLALYYHIANRKNRGSERLMDIFEERKHPITSDPIPVDYEFRDPEHKHIYRFIRILFTSAQLTAECAIITLVYIERLLTYAEIDLCPSNWRRVVLGAIMLASKVWDDQAVWNIDYCQILRRCTVDDMNELERQFLECLEFNINVPSSVYAKYYFDLRTLAIANDLHLPLQPLYKERAKKLEALSRIYEDKFLDVHKKTRRRWSSADRINATKNTVVIS